MNLLPASPSRIPVEPPPGYRWHMTPSIFEGGLVDLHLDEDPDYDGGWLSTRERRKLKRERERANGGPFPPETHIGTPIGKERHIRRVSKRIVREHWEGERRKAQWQALIDDFEKTANGSATARAVAESRLKNLVLPKS